MIVDCHVHFGGPDVYEKMIADQRQTGVDRFNIAVTPVLGKASDPGKLAHALWMKRRHPDMVYVFAGLDYTGMFDGGRDRPDVPLVEQLERLIALGCDGLKMLCGKPDSRKAIGQPLDGPLLEPLLARLEETHFPLLWHVADPPEFWDPEAVPLWAKQQRWWYDETFPTYEQINREVQAAFAQHPRLNLFLAHFFFISQNLEAAASFLETYPGFHFDLAPGVEMFHNFTQRRDETREFFIQYADRILYGTDIGAGRHCTGPRRGWMVRHWLETTDEFDVPDDPLMTPDERPPLKGIGLPAEALKRIYADNFLRILGHDEPRPLDDDAVAELIGDLGE